MFGTRVWPHEIKAKDARGHVTVTVVDAEQYDIGFPPTDSLLTFASWLEAIIDVIPEQYRQISKIEIDSHSGYEDSHYGHVEISYQRPETDEEWATRKADVERRMAAIEREEREQFEALKAKFG